MPELIVRDDGRIMRAIDALESLVHDRAVGRRTLVKRITSELKVPAG